MMKLRISIFNAIIVPFLLVAFFACHDDEPENPNLVKGEVLTPGSFNNMGIKAIAVEENGAKWVGSSHGLYKNQGSTWYKYALDTQLLAINSICINNNNLLVGTHSGVFNYTIEGNDLILQTTYKKASSGISSDTVLSIGYDPNNSLWLGSMFGLSLNTGNEWNNNADISSRLQTATSQISGMAFNPNKYFFSSLNKSLYHVRTNVETDAVSGASQMISPYNGELTSNTTYCVISAHDNGIWFGTDLGLTYNRTSTHIPNLAHPNPETDGVFEYYLRDIAVYCVLESPEGIVYAGTNQGLYIKNGDNWVTYTTTEGLVNNSIKAMAIDVDGSVWIGTVSGISHFTGNSFINY